MNRDRAALHRIDRRGFLGTLAASAVLLREGSAEAAGFAARPPAGFVPLSMPGRVVRVTKANTLQANGLWPTEAAARVMLERAMTELTGQNDMGAAFAKFVHKNDKVAIKPNGIAKTGMSTNKELVLEVVKGVMAAGVPASNITIFEQYPNRMTGSRIASRACVLDPAFPAGITAVVHENKDAVMPEIKVGGIATKFVRPLTEATAVINVGLIKDHSICGYTGCLKNITHGATINPHDFHAHHASPQIAEL